MKTKLKTELTLEDKAKALNDAKSGLVQMIGQVNYLNKFLEENPEPKDASEEVKKRYAERRLNIRDMETKMVAQDDYVAKLEEAIKNEEI